LRAKVDDFNLKSAAAVTLLTVLFVALPELVKMS